MNEPKLVILTGEKPKNIYEIVTTGVLEVRPTLFDKLTPVDQIRFMGLADGFNRGVSACESRHKEVKVREMAEFIGTALLLARKTKDFEGATIESAIKKYVERKK